MPASVLQRTQRWLPNKTTQTITAQHNSQSHPLRFSTPCGWGAGKTLTCRDERRGFVFPTSRVIAKHPRSRNFVWRANSCGLTLAAVLVRQSGVFSCQGCGKVTCQRLTDKPLGWHFLRHVACLRRPRARRSVKPIEDSEIERAVAAKKNAPPNAKARKLSQLAIEKK